MRTTIVLDDDVAERLRASMHATKRGMKATLNEVLRLGFEAKQQRAALPRFRVTPVDLGDLAPGIDLDRIADALEMAEGPAFK